MAIQKIEINDFLVFKGEFKAEFCDGVNVFIGGNGTGKTTLLRAIYNYNPLSVDSIDYKRFIRSFEDVIDIDLKDFDVFKISFKNISESDDLYEMNNFKKRLINVNLGGLVSQGYTFNYTLYYTDDKRSGNVIFIPVDEMLSHSKSLMALNHERKIPFRPEEIDILAKAELGEANELLEYEEKLLSKLSKIIGGIVIYDKDTFYIQKENGKLVEFSDEASGYKKLGLLWKLIRNGLIRKDTVLLWDEPENSLNPELMSALVEILLELSENGVQIFIATHDYDLARYFDVRKNKNIPVAFHNLVKKNNRIVCNTSNEYLKLNDNLLEKASADLFRAVTADAMEVQDDET
jgi:AAA15 family ATPase/GTPase